MAKLTFFSDTHGKHGQGALGQYEHFQDTDIAIFCGDMSGRGYKHEILNFVEWYKKMPVEHKILISGNHDFFWEQHNAQEKEVFLKDTGLIYLEDSGTEIEGIKFYGSPITPFFHNWAFNRLPDEIEKHWNLIPVETDILITHGPPFGFLDLVNNIYNNNKNTGCPYLAKHIFERVKPKVHAFGHIHPGYGVIEKDGTKFINAALLDDDYQLVNDPITIEI